MQRRELLAKFFGSTGTVMLFTNVPLFFKVFGFQSKSSSYPCILDCEIPQSLSAKEYLEKKYKVYSFKEIKDLVELFKQDGRLLSEYRVIKERNDRWHATFRSRQDFLDFVKASEALGLYQKQEILQDLHGLDQHWILPS